MGADLGALLNDDHAKIGIELLQADRGRKSGRSGADDDDVELHRLAGGQVGFGHALFPSKRARTRYALEVFHDFNAVTIAARACRSREAQFVGPGAGVKTCSPLTR